MEEVKKVDNLGKRECELKFEIENDFKKKKIIEELNQLGFKFISENLETDYTPDVDGLICKKNGLILRFRAIDGIEHRILITLKVKRDTPDFQDNYEIEFFFDDFNEQKFDLINGILYKCIKIKLPKDIFKQDNIVKISKELANIGLNRRRTFIQKRRSEYVLNDIKITIDELPKNIGTFLEIETNSRNELEKTVNLLHLNLNQSINKKYGKIIKEKQSYLPEEERGVCFFDNE